MAEKKDLTKIAITLLTLATAFYHLYLAFLPGWENFTILFSLDFIGYIGLLVLFLLPQLEEYKSHIRLLLIVLVVVNIVGFILGNLSNLFFFEGILTKTLEIFLLIALFYDFYLEKST